MGLEFTSPPGLFNFWSPYHDHYQHSAFKQFFPQILPDVEGGYGYIACLNSMLERTMIDILDGIKFARTDYFVKNHTFGIAGLAV